MFRVRGQTEIGLDDYLNKWGFGDGDDGLATEAGHQHRERAIRLIREEIQAVGLTLFVEDWDCGSIHNNCRIAIYNATHADDDKQVGVTLDGGMEVDGGLTLVQQRRLLTALKRASKRFDVGSHGTKGSFQAAGVHDTAPAAKPLTAREGARLLKQLAKEDEEHAEEFRQIATLLTARPH